MAKSIARNLADVASPTGVLDGTLSTAAQTNITSVGTLSSLTISGNLNATLTTAAQTNITSLGTLSSLNLSGALTGTTGTFTTADNLTQVRLISTDADASIGPRLDLFRNSASPAAGDFIEGTTGIVGINTNTPTSTLDVNGSTGIFVRHSTGGSLVLDDNDTADGSTPMVYMRNTAGTLKLGRANRNSGLTTGSTDSMTISATGDADFTGNVTVGEDTDITMDSSASGQLRIDGNGYFGATALDGTAMYVYHNSSSRNLVFGTNETAALTLAGSNQEATFAHHVNLADNKYLKLGDNDDMLIYHNGSASYIQSATADLDIIFRGNDTGTGGFDALTLDMSAGGIAKFSNSARPVTDGVGTLGGTSHRWGGLNIYSTTHEGVKFLIENTVGNSSMQGFRLDMNVSGSDTLTTDRAQYGQYITLDSSATGGDTADEHRLYGIRSSVKATGDSDLIYGGYFTGEAEHSAGTVSVLYGSYSQASADPESGGTVSNLYGAWNTATVYGSSGSTVQNAYASYNRTLLGTTDVVAHNTIHGVMAEIETDASGTARTTASGYLFRGLYDDDSSGEHKFTNFYGLHLASGALGSRTDGTGTVAGVYLDLPGAEAGFWNSEDQPNHFRGSLGIGSGSRQVGNTVGAELHLVEPDGGDMCLVRYDSTTQSNNTLGRIFWGSTENAGVNVNFSASIEGYAQTNHSTTDSDGYLSFKTTPGGTTTLIERMRILNDGEVVMAGDSNNYSNNDAKVCTMYCNSASNWALSVINDHASGYGMAVRSDSGNQVFFYIGGVHSGSITSSGTSTTYGNGSDYRLKENVSDLTGGIDRLKLLKPKRFNYIADETNTLRDGFIAHEAQTVIPEAVTGQKDDPIDDKGIGYQQLDYGQITPLLTAALQEAIAKIETLETKVKALEAK